MRYLNTISLSAFLLGCLTFGIVDAFFSKSTLNCKYQLLPEYINGIGDGEDEIYYSDIRGITHKPENRIFLNIKYESIVTLSIERSYDSDLELSYLNIVKYDKSEPSFLTTGNLTWGGAGNNTRLFLRSKLKPSQYIIVVGSTFHKDEEVEKVDNNVCSPVNFEFGLTTPETIYSQNSLSLNDPFSKPVVTINLNERYQYNNRIDDVFVVKTTPFGINSYTDNYRGNVLWSKLFIIPPSERKENEDLLNLYVELGFRFSRTPLQLIIEPVRTNRVKYESKLKDNNIHRDNSQRFFFGTPIFNGQLFRESMALKSFRIIVMAPLMSHLPLFTLFDLKISISFQSHSKQVINNFLPNQNDCNLKDLPTKIVQSGLNSNEILSLKNPGAIPNSNYYFGDKVIIQGPFESLVSKTNHLIHLVITKPSMIHLISHHDHSDIAISLSKSPSLTEEDEDLEFYLDDDDGEHEHDKTEIEEELRELDEYENNKYRKIANNGSGEGLRGLKNRITACSTINLNKKVSNKEMSLIFCKLNEPGDYYIHLHSFKISESQNSISLCTPFHLRLQITPHDDLNPNYSLCTNPIKQSKFKVPINDRIDMMNTKRYNILLDSKYKYNKSKEVHLFHKQELKVSGENNYLSIKLTIPESPKLLVFLNILHKGKIWLSLNPSDLHNYYSSSGPLISGTYIIQLFVVSPEGAIDPKSSSNCLSFDLNFSLIQLSPLDKSIEDPEIELFGRCIVSHMPLPRTIDLRSNSDSGEYIIDGTYLVPFDSQTGSADEKFVGEIAKEDGFILKEASYSHFITVFLSRPSVIYAAVSNYKGMVLIHTKDGNSNKHKIGSNNLNSFYREFQQGKYELIFEFDLMEDFIDETIQEGSCPVLKFHLSVTPLEVLPIFPPLVNNEVHRYVFGSNIEKDFTKRTHTELLSISRDYLNKLFPGKSLHFNLTRSALLGTSKENNDKDSSNRYISYKGNSIDILGISFWYSPFMKVTIPLETEFEETMFVIRVYLFPSWIPLSLKLLNLNSNNNNNHHLQKQNSAHYNGNNIEFSFSGVKKGSYQIVIHSKNQFTKNTMNKSSLMRISGFFRPILNTRLFSLRQELLSIPDILPFQELPDSLNRLRFFPKNNGQKGFVGTMMFTFKDIKKTNLVVPESTTLLLRFLSEPTLISGYDFHIVILKTKEGDDYVDNKPIFKSGKYGDTFVILDSGTYDLYFSPNPSNMPYLLTIGITRFNPSYYEDYFRKRVSFSNDSVGLLNKYNNDIKSKDFFETLVRTNMEDIFGPKQKCHFYLENFELKLNEKEDPYFNSGIINVCQGSLLKSENKLSDFTSGFHDIELIVGSSSMVYFHVNSDFLYSFYRIGIIVPEGYWVAEQRGKRSYLEVELTKGNYKLRVESMNSFTSFEEHDMIMFSMYVEISPIDGSEKFLENEGIINNSLDLFSDEYKQNGSKSKNYGDGNYESLCNIPNGVPLPLDLTSIQGGSTVFGGPLDTSKSMFLFRSRVTLSDIHNGRKKVFLELNKKYFPIYLRLSVSPVNFDISDSPNLLEVLFTKINSNKIDPVYSNSDTMINSIEKVFKIDFDTVQDEQKGATHIPYWLTFSHKLDSTSSRISCIAFDIVYHLVSTESSDLHFRSIPTYTNGIASSSSVHHLNQVESKLNNALRVKKTPQYVHIPVPNTSIKEVSNILDLGSGELEKDILIDLENIADVNQALLIAELYYNPLLIAAKMTLYSELPDENGENSELDELTLIKSSKMGFNGDIKSPFYVKETLSVVLTPQKHILECYIKSIPPYNLKKVPIMFGLSLVPLDHLLYKNDPLILYISPDTSVPILAGQNYHVTIKLSTPIGNKKSQILDSFYILNRRESAKGNRVKPYAAQILDSGYSLGISFRYTDVIKVLQDDADQFTKRGFLVIETSEIYQKEGKYKYKLAPWIKSYLSEKGKTYLEISCFKTNSLGWANIVWDGNLDNHNQYSSNSDDSSGTDIMTKTKGYNLRSNNVGVVSERPSVQREENAKDVSVNYNRPQIVGIEDDRSSNPVESFIQSGKEYEHYDNGGVISSLIDTNYNIGHYYYNNTIKNMEDASKRWIILLLVAILALIFYYRSQIYKLTVYVKDYISSYFSGYKNKNDYNLIEERNNFDFLSNIESEDEEDKRDIPGHDSLNGNSSPKPRSTQGYDLPYHPPPKNKKKA